MARPTVSGRVQTSQHLFKTIYYCWKLSIRESYLLEVCLELSIRGGCLGVGKHEAKRSVRQLSEAPRRACLLARRAEAPFGFG